MAIFSEIALRGPEKLQGQAPKIREVCADFEELRCLPIKLPVSGYFLMKDLAAVGGAVGLGELVVE
jgi:hypothetical protein